MLAVGTETLTDLKTYWFDLEDLPRFFLLKEHFSRGKTYAAPKLTLKKPEAGQ